QSDMCYRLLRAICCLCLLHTGLRAEECTQGVLAERETLHVPAGRSLSLSCVVQHCGDAWTGNWMRRNSTEEKSIAGHRLTNVTLSANQTQLTLNFLSVSKLDEGPYGCRVKWAQGDTDQGHLKYVNVTAAVSSQRSALHRVLVCAGASLCVPIILVMARCLSSEVKPQPFPRTLSTYSAVCRPQPAPQPPPRSLNMSAVIYLFTMLQVVYADISQDALGQQGATRPPEQSIVYSSLRFS
uniref:Ig-like domain-containing protein n=1 Tax=Cyclopterus lumpus TaxID=8103 RepID=A0A8C3A5K7_CYCLU